MCRCCRSGSAELLDAPAHARRRTRAPSSPTELAELAARTGELSDRLSRRYFALIESDAHALAT